MENIVWHDTKVNRYDREKNLSQNSKVLWFTGLSGSGKSTIANGVEQELYRRNKQTYLLDGDNMRFGLNKDLGFSNDDRRENIRRIAEVAKLFLDSGTITLCSFISPTNEIRDKARSIIGKDFIEVYVKCSLDVCADRDPKGLYKKAKRGDIDDFTGVGSSYEEPSSPDIVLETDKFGVQELVDVVIEYIEKLGVAYADNKT